MFEVTFNSGVVLGFGLPEDALEWFDIPREKVNRYDSETGFKMSFQESVFWAIIAQPNVKKVSIVSQNIKD